MAPTLIVERLTFTFPDGWTVTKYDDWTFYRDHYLRASNAVKGVDIIAISPSNECYLIEVKDYRHPETDLKNVSNLPNAVAQKFRDTLSAMLPAKLNGNKDDERAVAAQVLKATALHAVLHCEPSNPSSRGVVDLADIKQKLRSTARPVDAHAIVVSMAKPGNHPWRVS